MQTGIKMLQMAGNGKNRAKSSCMFMELPSYNGSAHGETKPETGRHKGHSPGSVGTAENASTSLAGS